MRFLRERSGLLGGKTFKVYKRYSFLCRFSTNLCANYKICNSYRKIVKILAGFQRNNTRSVCRKCLFHIYMFIETGRLKRGQSHMKKIFFVLHYHLSFV